MSKTIKIVAGIIGGILVITLLIGAALVGVHAAAAQDGGNPATPDNGDANHPKLHKTPGLHEFVHESVEEAQAAALGMTDAELHDAVLSGKTIRELVEEKGLDPKEFHTMMQTARRDAIQQAVEKGLITQEEADFILQHMDQHPHHGKHHPKGQPDQQPTQEPQG